MTGRGFFGLLFCAFAAVATRALRGVQPEPLRLKDLEAVYIEASRGLNQPDFMVCSQEVYLYLQHRFNCPIMAEIGNYCRCACNKGWHREKREIGTKFDPTRLPA